MVCSNCGNRIWSNFYNTTEKNRKVCACCGTLVYDQDDIGENRRDELSRLENGFSFLHSYDFDGAKETFSRVLDDHPDSVNARWGYLLAHYGIVYVRGFFDRKISPTYCFTEYDPEYISYFSEQEKFKELLQFLSNEPKLSAIYKEKAKEIDQAMNDFAAAREEKEYDVFLCVKISKTLKSHPDQTGNTELDYPKALKLYKTLTQRGLKVFFSKVALDANPESDMDIWKNLVRSKKMLLITSKRDYLENDSPWVHSEWQRWLHLDRNGDNDHKRNLYVYLIGNMQASNLPEKLKRQVYTERDGMERKLIADICQNPVVPVEQKIAKDDKPGYAFISYSSLNKPSADKLREIFHKNHIDTWMAPYSIPPGYTYPEKITGAIRDCSCFVLILTNASQNSDEVSGEVNLAKRFRKPFIIIQLEDMNINDSFLYYINNKHIVRMNAIKEHSDDMQNILATVKKYVGQKATTESEEQEESKVTEEKEKSASKENRIVFGTMLGFSILAMAFGIWGSFRYIFTNERLWTIYLGLNILMPAEWLALEIFYPKIFSIKQTIILSALSGFQYLLILFNPWELIIREKPSDFSGFIIMGPIFFVQSILILYFDKNVDTFFGKIFTRILNILVKGLLIFYILSFSIVFIANANVPIRSQDALLYIDSTKKYSGLKEEDKNTYAVWFGNYWDDELIIPTQIGDKSVAFVIKSTENKWYFRYSRMETVYIPSTMKYIGDNAFDCCDKLETVYYAGSEEAWKKVYISKGNDAITQADIYFYSETRPQTDGLYWHYVDGNITQWK